MHVPSQYDAFGSPWGCQRGPALLYKGALRRCGSAARGPERGSFDKTWSGTGRVLEAQWRFRLDTSLGAAARGPESVWRRVLEARHKPGWPRDTSEPEAPIAVPIPSPEPGQMFDRPPLQTLRAGHARLLDRPPHVERGRREQNPPRRAPGEPCEIETNLHLCSMSLKTISAKAKTRGDSTSGMYPTTEIALSAVRTKSTVKRGGSTTCRKSCCLEYACETPLGASERGSEKWARKMTRVPHGMWSESAPQSSDHLMRWSRSVRSRACSRPFFWLCRIKGCRWHRFSSKSELCEANSS